MIDLLSIPLQYNAEYFYSLSLFIGAVVNVLLAGMLLFDHDNFLYYGTRYLRARYLTALSLIVFAVGFFLHWLFLPRYTNPLAASALSLAYFHLGGMLFSMSHTSILDRHYLTRSVVIHDVGVTTISLTIYALSVILGSKALLYIGFALFFLHVFYLTHKFFRSFHRAYALLGNYANEYAHDTDRDIRWLFFSCYVIIFFGIAGIAVTYIFPEDTLPFTILMFIGVIAFTYIYKALDAFGSIAIEAEKNINDSEAYLSTEKGKKEMSIFLIKREWKEALTIFPFLSGFFKQW